MSELIRDPMMHEAQSIEFDHAVAWRTIALRWGLPLLALAAIERAFIRAEAHWATSSLTVLTLLVVWGLLFRKDFLRNRRTMRIVDSLLLGVPFLTVAFAALQIMGFESSSGLALMRDKLWWAPLSAAFAGLVLYRKPLYLAGYVGTFVALVVMSHMYAHLKWGAVVVPLGIVSYVAQTTLCAGVAVVLLRYQQSLLELVSRFQVAEAKSMQDALTGLPNRRGFMRDSEKLTGAHSLVILDIDGFKAINDTQGHAVGDSVLHRVAAAIDAWLPPFARAYRWGGDEFIALIPQTGISAEQHAQALRKAIQHATSALAQPVTVSVGVADFDGSLGLDMAFKRADSALLMAKQGGRNRVTLAYSS